VCDEHRKTPLEIFEAALDIEPHERSRWIDLACGSDAALADDVKSLLDAHALAGNFLDHGLTVAQSRGANGRAVEPFVMTGRQLGDFLIEQQVGAGGMGVVYRAQQISLNRPVALKVLPPHLRSSESARTRFQREVEAAARLRHRNVVAVYTTGEESGTAYYAMELIVGAPLSQVIEELRRRPPRQVGACLPIDGPAGSLDNSTHGRADDLTPPPETAPPAVDLASLTTPDGYFLAVARLMMHVAEGLAYAHEMQVIHRDIKPSNLLLGRDGEIHISDFGLARLMEEPGLTRTGDFLGTPYYMAPEQISTGYGPIDERTDVYALGATLYELLTLRKPFPGENREQVIAKILHKEPTPPRSINRLVPRDLDTICLKALEKEPQRRYASAGDVAEDLRRFVERRPILARREGAVGRGIAWARRHRAWSTAIGGFAALLLLAAFFAYRTHVAELKWNDAEFGRVFETAQLAAIEGDLNKAEAAVAQARQLGAPPAQLALLRGQLDLRAGKIQEACDTLEQAIRELPQSVAAHALLVNAYGANEQNEKRMQAATRLAILQPSTLQDYLMLGEAQAYTNFDQSHATLNDAVARYKTSVVARLTRGSMSVYRAMDSADIALADETLDDLRIASELLEPNPLVLSRMVQARLIAATAYAAAGDIGKRQEHLDRAAEAVKALAEYPSHYKSHWWRATYFDYIGDDDRAIEAWLAMKDHSITFLTLSLYRVGRFQEALDLCDERLARYKGARFTEFLRSFILAASAENLEDFLFAFELRGKETLDSVNSHRFTYTIDCLAGQPHRARQFSRDLRQADPHLAANEHPWQTILDYCCGELSEEALLADLADSRSSLCQAQFLVGMTHLANGDRAKARQHYQAASDLKIVNYVEDYLSRALLAQLDRDPNWPRWIPSTTTK